MTYVTIGLPAGGAVVEVQTPERLIHMRGGEKITLDMSLRGDRIVLTMVQLPDDGKRHRGVPEDVNLRDVGE